MTNYKRIGVKEIINIKRQPDAYINKKVILTGFVTDVHEYNDAFKMFLNVKEIGRETIVNVVYPKKFDNRRILENDCVEVCGAIKGIYEYKAINNSKNYVVDIIAEKQVTISKVNKYALKQATKFLIATIFIMIVFFKILLSI